VVEAGPPHQTGHRHSTTIPSWMETLGGVYKSVGNCLRPTCACAAPMIRGGWGQAAFVIPAQAGIQPCEGSGWVTAQAWTPAFAGVTALLASPQRIPTEIDTEPNTRLGSPVSAKSASDGRTQWSPSHRWDGKVHREGLVLLLMMVLPVEAGTHKQQQQNYRCGVPSHAWDGSAPPCHGWDGSRVCSCRTAGTTTRANEGKARGSYQAPDRSCALGGASLPRDLDSEQAMAAS